MDEQVILPQGVLADLIDALGAILVPKDPDTP